MAYSVVAQAIYSSYPWPGVLVYSLTQDSMIPDEYRLSPGAEPVSPSQPRRVLAARRGRLLAGRGGGVTSHRDC